MADAMVTELLRRRPKSPAESLGVDVAANTPAPLFQWLVTSLLISAPISAKLAMKGAHALIDAGLTTPEKMRDADWEERVKLLNESGYARVDEKTSTQLAELSERVLDEYGGDLRKLREAAGGDPAKIRARLKDFKGIGDTGADVFCREAQRAWDELFPFADAKALEAAEKLGLGADAEALADKVERREDLPRLLSALVGADLSDELEEIAAAAR
ncbi:MAG: hypothetical protein R6V44_04780 [Paracoccaceae bacterium]